MNKTIAIAGLGSLLLASAGTANAQDGRFTWEGSIELQSDVLFDSSNPANELNDTYMTINGALSYAITSRTSVNASLVIEPIIGAVKDRVLEDHGLYAEELYFAHDFGPAEVVLGKFNPAFGAAWDLAPGLYGADFAEDYQLTERVGAAINIALPLGVGEHVLSFAAFNADRSIFSESLGRKRPQNNLSAGGVSNTSDPESFALSLMGEVGNTAYNIGIQNQARGVGDVTDQTGFVAGVVYVLGEGSSVPVELLGEVAYFDAFGGVRADATIATFGAAFAVGPATVSGVYAVRDIQNAPTDHLATLSVEVPVTDSLSTTIGYRYGREAGDRNHTLGSVLTYEF
ncbi:hypothetical protein [Roseovarius pelagicus]|uniref:Porin n=1 Tax=Roseovarius pelagicus TaxID=2980108 RepID=A0ABY6D7Y5_9RHOB|nr:hypothetical protein [Roseovarius pelagicus]UXX82237.1 hypothetical protein N7U68_14150 [Roseovarius pelagicus]